MKKKKMWILPTVLIGLFLLYMIVCGTIFLVDVLKMNKLNETCCDVVSGTLAYEKSTAYKVYSEEEIAQNPALAGVTIDYFPAEGSEKRFVVICPGGAYTGVSVEQEGYPVADYLNKEGFSCFVLTYRTGENCSYHAPLDDVAKALTFIRNRSESFRIDKDSYALCGFSAGGNLIGMFGSERWGYLRYGLPAPQCLIMGYPWCNPNVKSKGNLVETIAHAVLNKQGQEAFLEGKSLSEMQVQLYVTENYPPCYIMHGTSDTIVPIWSHSEVLCQKLQEKNVRYILEKADGVYHGCGIGKGTSCDGWLSRAVNFWNTINQ